MKYALMTTALVLAATPVAATTFQHSATANINGVENATYTYNDTNDQFSLSFNTISGDGTDGMWFVVNDGPQPYHEGQGHLAIFYSDLTDVWAYQYTGAGVRGVNASYKGVFLDKFDNAVTSTVNGNKTNFAMSLDLTTVNSANLTPDWLGLQFNTSIGTWLHTTQNTFSSCGGTYQSGDALTCFAGNDWLGWDGDTQTASIMSTGAVLGDAVSAVPLPAAGWFLLAGVGGLGLLRRKS